MTLTIAIRSHQCRVDMLGSDAETVASRLTHQHAFGRGALDEIRQKGGKVLSRVGTAEFHDVVKDVQSDLFEFLIARLLQKSFYRHEQIRILKKNMVSQNKHTYHQLKHWWHDQFADGQEVGFLRFDNRVDGGADLVQRNGSMEKG